MRTSSRFLTAVLAVALLAAAGCGDDNDDDASGGASGSGDAGGTSSSGTGDLSGTLTVFAAASLTDVLPALGDRLEADNPDLDVQFNFAGSSALATQLTQGAPADVFASANTDQMTVVTAADLADGDPAVFAANVLEIAVPAGNPGDVSGLADFARKDLTLAVCAPEVPCGAAAQRAFAAAGIDAVPDTQEEDVRAALTKVELGEVDAALVYATDVAAAADEVEGIELPDAQNVVSDYPVCVLTDAPNPEAARAFVDLLLSDEGRTVLEDAGFRLP